MRRLGLKQGLIFVWKLQYTVSAISAICCIDSSAYITCIIINHDTKPSSIMSIMKKICPKVSGPSPPKPVTSFAHFGFDDCLMKAIRKSEFSQPTPIQSMGIPAVLSGRDVIGIAQTGSGKTAAFIWPLLIHIMDQPEIRLVIKYYMERCCRYCNSILHRTDMNKKDVALRRRITIYVLSVWGHYVSSILLCRVHFHLLAVCAV